MVLGKLSQRLVREEVQKYFVIVVSDSDNQCKLQSSQQSTHFLSNFFVLFSFGDWPFDAQARQKITKTTHVQRDIIHLWSVYELVFGSSKSQQNQENLAKKEENNGA